jgi:hypothetical protein
MKDRKRETFEPVTLGHIRSRGVRNLLVYCNSIACNHQTIMNADHCRTRQSSGRWARV